MKLNLEFYNEKDDILKISQEENIEKYSNQNILNWYPFEEDISILQIGIGLTNITDFLCKKAKKIVVVDSNIDTAKKVAENNKDYKNLEVIVSKFNNVKLEEKFDYIILIGTLPYIAKECNKTSEEILNNLQCLLKENGKILIAVDNKFAIKYFVGNPENYLNKKFVSLLNYNNEEEKIETYTKQKLLNITKNSGYEGINFYYPLPDYKMPNVIFSDRQMPKYNTIDKYTPYMMENSDILIDEIDLFREILKTDESQFTFFANSYFIEISKKKINNKYKFISYNNMRKPKYRLITKMSDEFVEKDIAEEEAKKHYDKIKENIKSLNKVNINILDNIEDGKIISTYVKQDYMLSNILTKKLEEGKIEEFYKILDEFYNLIKKSSNKTKDTSKTVFEKYKIEINQTKKDKLYFLENGFWDMTFKNCFYIDNKFYLFDQEWMEKNVPAQYILYRSIIYTISLRRFINIDKLIQKYKLDEFIEEFKVLDNKMQEKIRDNESWEFYSKKQTIDIDAMKQEMVNIQIRDKAKDDAIDNMKKQMIELESISFKTFLKHKFLKKGRSLNE